MTSRPSCDDDRVSSGPVAFVLGGGGVLGAVEVGMLQALLEYGVHPDLIVGTSIGALNGVLVAADPTPAVTQRLAKLWASPEARAVYGDSPHRQLVRIARGGTHLHSPAPLRDLLHRELGAGATFDDLAVRFQCCAASIERAAEHWFDRGEVVRVRVRIEGTDPDSAPRGRPLLVLCRHAGPGDSFLLAHALINWYDREPRIVLEESLQWDPAINVLLNRLPSTS